MSDYHNIIKSVNSQQDFHNYLFIVQPLLDEEEQEDHEDWEGGINAVKKVLKHELRHLENRVINLETTIDKDLGQKVNQLQQSVSVNQNKII